MTTTPRPRCIAVANMKGGTGKTTTVLNIAGVAASLGKRVLMIDTDPQASLTRVALTDTPPVSLGDAFLQRARSLEGIRLPSRYPQIDLVPTSLTFGAALQTALGWHSREFVLLDMLAPHIEEYDLILIDCKPDIDLSVLNALTAADWLLCPVECSFLALDGFEHVHALQQQLNARINPNLRLLGLLPTRYRAGTTHGQWALEQIQQQAERVQAPLQFAPIRNAAAAADSPSYGQSLVEYAPRSEVAQDYRRVAEQILTFLEKP